MRLHYMSVKNIVKKGDIGIITHTFTVEKNPVFAEKPLLNSTSESKEQEPTGIDQNYFPRPEPFSLEQNKRCCSCAPREWSGGIRLPQSVFVCL